MQYQLPLPADRPTTIMLVDDHPVLRGGLRRILEEHHYRVVAEAGNGEEALASLSRHKPTIVILDIGLPGVRGIELAAEMLESRPDARIIFLTVHRDEEYVYQALSMGASGYVLKDCLDTEVVEAVRRVEGGGRYLTPLISNEIVSACIARGGSSVSPAFDALTLREREVLALVCDGESSKGLAARLGISARTAEHHRQAIMRKLGARSIAELIKLAIRHRLIEV